MLPVWINRIATAVPANEVHRKFLEFVPRMLDDPRQRRVFARLAGKAQIERRYSVLEPSPNPQLLDTREFYVAGRFPTTATRMQVFEKHALPLALEACERALEGVPRDEITHLVVTCCTGFSAPGLDLQLQQALGLRASLERTIIGFMGCYAALNGLKSAYHAVRSQLGAKVLLVNLELCTLHLRAGADMEGLLGFLQFSDGCATSLISASSGGLEIQGFHCDVMPERSDLIAWHIADDGFAMNLSPELPKVLGDNIEGLTRWLNPRPKLWAVHPGGRAIVDAVESGLGLQPSDLRHSRDVLRDYGNMSSATVMFVLRRILDADVRGDGVAMSFGPGLTLESMLFRKHADA